MKSFLKIVLLALIVQQITNAQIVTSTPSIPTENDSIVIYFDATQEGASELLNYTGTIYAHTGVTSNLGTWQHVVGNWGNNTTQPALTRLGTNLYKLTIGYPRKFYSVTNSSEKISQLDIVFRSADNSKQTRPDIFYNIYEPGLTLEVDNPEVSVPYGDPQRSPAFVKFGQTIPIIVKAIELGTKVSTLTLYVDDNEVTQTDQDSLGYNFVHANFSAGPHNIKAVGIDTSGNVDSTTFMMFSNPANKNFPLPAGLEQGINYTGPTTAVLALYAPMKDYVYVIGDFNDWKVETDYMMNREFITNDSVLYWLELTSLSPGTEYAFQYLVDGSLRIGDPYCDKILDPSNDKYIDASTYPNLKPYPNGKTGNLVSVLQTAQSEYQWQVTDFQKPPKDKLVIYELLVRDFSSVHDYQFLIDTLSYLKSLGVNAIELMPINEFEGNISWGYNPSYHFAPDKYYGTKNDLKEFIDVAHQNGIAVIMDIVLNHAFGQNPLVAMYFDGYYTIGGNSGIVTVAGNPYFNVTSPNTSYFWGADFNHLSTATQYYIDRVNRHWLEEYKFDGFRFDFTKGFTNTPGDGGAYDQSRINILERMADKIWSYDSTAYVILEHFAANNEEIVLSNYGMMIWGNINYNYNEATMGYTSNLYGVSYKYLGWNYPHLVGYMESHDEERLMYKNLRFGSSNDSYDVKDLAVALNRMKLAAAFFFTIPGPKMIWQFGELGYDYSINYDPGISGVPEPYGAPGKDYARTYPKPIKWDYQNDERREKVYKVFKALIGLKKDYQVFSTTNFSLDVANTIKKINLYDSTMDAYIIGNFSVYAINASQNFSKTGWWYDYFTGDSVEVTNINASIILAPGEFKLYTTVKLPTPEGDIISEVEVDNPITINEYSLDQNYPNPFNPSTVIRYSIVNPSVVSLKIYDVLGREVKTLVNQQQGNGIYEVNWNGDNEFGSKVSTGVYFYRLETGNFVDTKKMMYLK